MPPKGSDLVFDHRHNAADRVFSDRGLGRPDRRGARTASVVYVGSDGTEWLPDRRQFSRPAAGQPAAVRPGNPCI